LTIGCIVYTAGCQTGCITRFDNWLNEQWLFVQHGHGVLDHITAELTLLKPELETEVCSKTEVNLGILVSD